MTSKPDPHAVFAASGDEPPQHLPRVPGDQGDTQDGRDLPGKPYRTPGKNKTHPAPDVGADGLPRRDDQTPKTP